MTGKKKRPTPAFDRSVVTLKNIHSLAKRKRWSAKQVRSAVKLARDASKPVWRRAILHVFGKPVIELPDFRQVEMFEVG